MWILGALDAADGGFGGICSVTLAWVNHGSDVLVLLVWDRPSRGMVCHFYSICLGMEHWER